MNKQFTITREPEGIHVVFFGQISVQTILDAHSAYNLQSEEHELAYGIWDYSKVDPTAFEESSLYRIIASDLKTSVALQFHKMAIIAIDSRARELSRLYMEGFMACHERWEIQLFYSEAEARAWISQ